MNARKALEYLKENSGKGIATDSLPSIEIWWDGYSIELEHFEDPHVKLDEDQFLNEFKDHTFCELGE